MDTSSADQADGTLTWRRRRAEQLRSPITRQSEEQFTDGDDEILESLVKTATKAPGTRTTPRERKRTRHADRKSCKLTTQVIRLRSTSKTPIERIRFNEKVLVYIFSNRTQRAMSITSSWILSTRNTHYTIKNSTEKLLYIVIQILISHTKFQIYTSTCSFPYLFTIFSRLRSFCPLSFASLRICCLYWVLIYFHFVLLPLTHQSNKPIKNQIK